MRHAIRRIFLLSSLAVCTGAFAARDYVDLEQRLTQQQLHATGLDSLSAEQLKLLNDLLRDESAAVAESRPTAAGADASRHSYIGLDDQPINSRLKGSINGWEPGSVFELENGQQWKVLKGSAKLPQPLQSPTVVVVPGIAGRWFLQVSEDLPKARVYRID